MNPRKRFGIPFDNSYTVWKLGEKVKINADDFLSKGKSTPFLNIEVFSSCVLTVCKGKIAYKK